MSMELKERCTEEAKSWKTERITKRHTESAFISVSFVKSESSSGTSVGGRNNKQ